MMNPVADFDQGLMIVEIRLIVALDLVAPEMYNDLIIV
jgi:hypothetical protein